jgi:1,4-dihydroxy-6-naphthoate synthase
MSATQRLIRVGHSPDPDDAFMFHALANDCLPTGNYMFTHILQDIETLNRRALAAELELTAVSLHGYAYLTDKYALCHCGASMGDGYGPMVVAKQKLSRDEVRMKKIAVPGTMTTAFLAMSLWLNDAPGGQATAPAAKSRRPFPKDFVPLAAQRAEFQFEVYPFDEILNIVERGECEAGLIIHEGQLTYEQQGLELCVDLGAWWMEETGLPLPLGANAIRKDLGPQAMRDVTELLKQSIAYGLEHRDAALTHALQYGRDLDRAQADKFVGMYVNDWTIDFGPRGREAVAALLNRGYEAGLIPEPVELEFM